MCYMDAWQEHTGVTYRWSDLTARQASGSSSLQWKNSAPWQSNCLPGFSGTAQATKHFQRRVPWSAHVKRHSRRSSNALLQGRTVRAGTRYHHCLRQPSGVLSHLRSQDQSPNKQNPKQCQYPLQLVLTNSKITLLALMFGPRQVKDLPSIGGLLGYW